MFARAFALAIFVVGTPALGATIDLTTDEWREDLHAMVQALESMHPDVFYASDEARAKGDVQRGPRGVQCGVTCIPVFCFNRFQVIPVEQQRRSERQQRGNDSRASIGDSAESPDCQVELFHLPAVGLSQLRNKLFE